VARLKPVTRHERSQHGSQEEEGWPQVRKSGVEEGRRRDEEAEEGHAQVGPLWTQGEEQEAGDRDRLVGGSTLGGKGAEEEEGLEEEELEEEELEAEELEAEELEAEELEAEQQLTAADVVHVVVD
jgi:hypothetical protein